MIWRVRTDPSFRLGNEGKVLVVAGSTERKVVLTALYNQELYGIYNIYYIYIYTVKIQIFSSAILL